MGKVKFVEPGEIAQRLHIRHERAETSHLGELIELAKPLRLKDSAPGGSSPAYPT